MMWELSILSKYSWIERKDQAREAMVLGLDVTLATNLTLDRVCVPRGM